MGCASVEESCCDPNCVCGCNQQPNDDSAFWQEFVSQLISMVCLIEREKLRPTHTTSELRGIAKDALCKERET